MPAYNVARFIEAAVDSVLKQTFTDFELIVIDDGSTDDTAEVVRRLRERAPETIQLRQQPNGGLSAARNAGIEAARGQYIALLDSDDLWEPGFLQAQVEILERNADIDVVTGNAWFLGGPKHGLPVRPHPDARPQPTLHRILADEEAVFIMSLFRRTVYERIGPFNEAFRTNEDYDFWLRAAAAGSRFFRNSQPLAWYRVREGSLSADQVRMLRGILAVYAGFRPRLAPGSTELRALDGQVVRFQTESYAASARVGVPATHHIAHRAFVAACIARQLPLKTALSGTLARYAPSVLRRLDRIGSSDRAEQPAASASPAAGPGIGASAATLDRAGREYWDGVWKHIDFAPDIDPTSPSIWAHRDQEFHRFFREQLASAQPGLRLLELGCARSAWLPYFAREFGCQISGLDYVEAGARQTADRLRQLSIPADIRCGDLFQPPADWVEAFDVVTWFGVAEHFEDTAQVVRAAAAYLKPGGLLLTEIPNMSGLIGTLQRLFNKPIYDIHVPLNGPQLAAGHTAAGLEVLATRYLVPTDFGVVNLENLPDSLVLRVKDKTLYGLRLLSGCIWWLDRRWGPLQPGQFTSGFVIVAARKPPDSQARFRAPSQSADTRRFGDLDHPDPGKVIEHWKGAQ